MTEELNWTNENQVSLNAAVYDAMWHWDDIPMDTDDAMSLAAILKEKITENGLRLVCSHALTASQARAEALLNPDPWRPISEATPFDRVLVSGGQKPHGTVAGYWWWHEDDLDASGIPLGHPNATHWRPIGPLPGDQS